VIHPFFPLLVQRYPAPEWVLVPEVRDGTGFTGSRTADAVAMNCYPSKGLEVHGFEFKRARSDWLRELEDGAKADAVARHCDRWWIVADEGVVRREELPKPWGLVVVKADVLRQAAAALPLPRSRRPDLDRCFVASFLRGCLRRAAKPGEEELAAAVRRGRDQESAVRAAAAQDAGAEARRLRDSIDAFERASGVKIDKWTAPSVGAAFRAFLEIAEERRHDRVERASARLREQAEALDVLARELAALAVPSSAAMGDQA
jgi:hypothetical protein